MYGFIDQKKETFTLFDSNFIKSYECKNLQNMKFTIDKKYIDRHDL